MCHALLRIKPELSWTSSQDRKAMMKSVYSMYNKMSHYTNTPFRPHCWPVITPLPLRTIRGNIMLIHVCLQYTTDVRSTYLVASRARYESCELLMNCITVGETEAECHIFRFSIFICNTRRYCKHQDFDTIPLTSRNANAKYTGSNT
jgi:hypothetical protein